MSPAAHPLSPGSPAPACVLPDGAGEPVDLATLAGRWVVLYFYPRDDTPGCTTEALEFSEALDSFAALGAEVLGVSPDTAARHERFATKHGLRHTLLSDPEHAVLERFGAWGLKKLYGKESWGVVRSTVLIDPAGQVRRVWPKVKAKGHAAEVLEALRALQA